MKNQSPSFRQHMVAHIKKVTVVTVLPSPLVLHCLQNLIKQIFIAIDKIKKTHTLLMTMHVIVVFVAFSEI